MFEVTKRYRASKHGDMGAKKDKEEKIGTWVSHTTSSGWAPYFVWQERLKGSWLKFTGESIEN